MLFVAPFVLGFSYLAGALSIVIGILLIGLAASVYGEGDRGNSAAERPRGTRLRPSPPRRSWPGPWPGSGGTHVAIIFLVGFGSAHLALTASTRFSRPLGSWIPATSHRQHTYLSSL